MVDSPKALDQNRPIREADISRQARSAGSVENDPNQTSQRNKVLGLALLQSREAALKIE